MTAEPAQRKREIEIKPLRLISFALLVAAVVKELRLPPGKRTWHGLIAGVIPYELRRPTIDRFASRVWSPDVPHLFLPRAFGVGWSPNIGRMVTVVRHRTRT